MTQDTGQINVRGVNHHYEWIRQPEASVEKPVMVFIHGWGGSARYWQKTAQALSKHFDCLLYDMRGFGRSLLPLSNPSALTYELEDYADDLAALLDALGLEKIYLNGHSMGASIATLFLNRYPQRVKRAILTCSGIFEYEEKSFKTFHKAGTYVVKFRYKWFLRVPFAERLFMARFLHRRLSRQICREFLEDFLIANYDAAVGTIYTSVSKKAAEMMPGEFAKLQVPTLLVSGEKDIIIPAAMGREAASKSEKVEYFEIPNTAHFPMLEDEETYLNRVLQFLEVSETPELVPESS
ncbi:MAG: alpha/beta fold hydrolase [Cyanobacteriota bacterium]